MDDIKDKIKKISSLLKDKNFKFKQYKQNFYKAYGQIILGMDNQYTLRRRLRRKYFDLGYLRVRPF